jgi:glycosyltransferase involved in cell wall biosynthesis
LITMLSTSTKYPKAFPSSRILLVLPSLRGGGAERVFLTLLRHLNRQRFEPHLALLSQEADYLHQIPGDVETHVLHAERVRYALPALLRLAWRLRPRVILSTLGHLNLLLILLRLALPPGTRLLVREAMFPSVSLPKSRHPRLLAALYRRFYGRADLIICPSQAVVMDLEQNFGIPAPQMVLIYNPIDQRRILTQARSSISPYLKDGVQMLAVGRLEYQKGFDLLLIAFAQVLRQKPAAHLTILGKGSERDCLINLADELGISQALTFAGFQANPYPYFYYADLMLLSSRFEGLPNVVLEALVCGTPVLACDTPGGAREIIQDGVNGWLVPGQNVDSLAAKMLTAMEQVATGRSPTPEQVQGSVARFGISNIIKQYETVLAGEGGT